jgi:hypothetical protein
MFAYHFCASHFSFGRAIFIAGFLVAADPAHCA